MAGICYRLVAGHRVLPHTLVRRRSAELGHLNKNTTSDSGSTLPRLIKIQILNTNNHEHIWIEYTRCLNGSAGLISSRIRGFWNGEFLTEINKHVVTGPIRRLSQRHPTITKSYRYSWIHNNNKHTKWARKFPGAFANIQKIWRISRNVRHPEYCKPCIFREH